MSRRKSLLEAANGPQKSNTTPASKPVVTEIPLPKTEPITDSQQRSRVGKKPVTTYISPEAKKQLLYLKTDTDKDIEDLLREGINMLFEKYGKNPIA